jgi:putative CocE/NonD family hydrolase
MAEILRKNMADTLKTLRAAWPMLSRAIKSGQLFRPQCRLVEPDEDIHCDYDVEIPMSEGYSLTCNIFRSKRRQLAGEATPVIMCAHPYDNHITPALKQTPLGGPPQQYRLIPQVGGYPSFSTLTSWESPDPNFWVQAGYTLVNVNLPGYANSGGPGTIMTHHQGKCYREAIAWAGAQPLCDGGVGLSGVSYLAISQYFAAGAPLGEVPAALKCISPWEGFSDFYRDLACAAGVADVGFLNFWWHTEVKESLNHTLEEFLLTEEAIPVEVLARHPLFDEYWQNKAARLEEILVPMLVCGSFSDHELHTMGSFRAFERAQSAKKWIYTHRGGKWSTYYSDEVLSLTKDFMDHFLKGVDNRFVDLPPVHLEVRSSGDRVHDIRWEQDWPLPNTEYVPLYLDDYRLGTTSPDVPAEIAYTSETGSATFEHVFETDTELSGYMKLKLWVEVRPESAGQSQPDDMILCVFVDKLDRDGNSVRFNGSVGVTDDVVTRGYIRASHRALNVNASTPWLPVSLGTSEEKLTAGEIVPLEIALRPSSTFFAAGEGLKLIVSPTDIVRAPIFHKDTSANDGCHVLHFGGSYDAHLLTPVIAVSRQQD